MAIVWGSYVNNFRLGIDIVGSTWIVYGESNAYGHDWNYTLQFGGSWGSGTKSGHFYSGWGQTVRRELHRTTRPNVTQSNNVRLTSVLVNGAYVSRGLTVTPKPSAPRIDRVVRNSDSSHRVEWTRYATATSVRLERRTNGGSWQHVSSVSSNAASITDTTTRANNRYQYRVRVANAGGTSDWSNLSSNVYTTPGVPSGVTATRVGDNIRVNGSVPAVASHVDIQDDGTDVSGALAKGSLPWTHTNPDQAVTHRYRMRARVNSGTSNSTLLTSAYSAYSATVQLTAPPNAPTGLSPNGAVVESGATVSLSWTHNPVDASEQTAYELRYRVDAGAWTTLSGTTAGSRAVTFGTGAVEWQARTKGAHPDWSPWSAVAQFTAISKPTVTIETPSDGDFHEAVLPVTWSFFQAQGRPQSAWRARLLRDGQLLETKQGTGSATSTTFSHRLEDGHSYTVEVDAASGSIWSAVESVSVDASFILPAPAVLEGVWNDSTGAVDLQVSVLDQPPRADVVNYAPRIEGSDTWAEVRRNRVLNPTAAVNVSNIGPYGANVNISRVTFGGVPAMAATVSPGASAANIGFYVNIGTSFAPGERASIRFLVNVSSNLNGTQEFRAILGGLGVGETNTVSTLVSVQGGTWQEVELVLPSVTGGGTFPERVYFTRAGTGMPAGTAVFVRDVQVDTYVDGYFNGSTTPATAVGIDQPADFRWRWLGPVHASESVMEIETVAGATPTNAVAGLTTLGGRPAIRAIPITPYFSSTVRLPIPANVRAEGTVLATVNLTAPIINGSVDTAKVGATAPFQWAQAPNEAGSFGLRAHYSGLTGTYQVVLFHGGRLGSGEMVFSEIALMPANYQGGHFDGDTEWVEIDGVWMHTRWNPDGTSTASMPDDAVSMTVERSIDDGITWMPVLVDDTGVVQVADYESLSNGVTVYRVTTFAATGAATVREYPVPADSMKVWLGAGQGFGDTAGLPYDPTLGLAPERERGMWRLAGNTRVAWAGEQAGRTVAAGGRLFEGSEESASYEDLSRIFLNPEPLHLYRSPNGDHVYGVLSSPDLQRAPGVGVWSYGFQIEEADKE